MTLVPGVSEEDVRILVRELAAPDVATFGPNTVEVEVQFGTDPRFPETMISALYDRGALLRALLPDEVRHYLLDLIDAIDDGLEVEWGHAPTVREEAGSLLALP